MTVHSIMIAASPKSECTLSGVNEKEGRYFEASPVEMHSKSPSSLSPFSVARFTPRLARVGAIAHSLQIRVDRRWEAINA